MGTVTVARKREWVANGLRYVECDITGSSSYATNGDTLPASAFGFKEIREFYQVGTKTTFDGKNVASDYANKGAAHVADLANPSSPLILRYVNNVEASAAANWSTAVIRCVVAGR